VDGADQEGVYKKKSVRKAPPPLLLGAQSTPTIRFHPRNDGTAISFKVYRKIITGENRDRTAG
jgi:hypothetical protein